ncbi:hypothetical protein [Alkalibacillus silvisoli]|uniref:Uncharacterized protein n=1 Tax=Alkalibacillus silvisoli TaxID=392823 RepID=A0ABN0ZKK4_9BACI
MSTFNIMGLIPFVIFFAILILLIIGVTRGLSSILPTSFIKHQNRIILMGYSIVVIIGALGYFLIIDRDSEVAYMMDEERYEEILEMDRALLNGTFDQFEELSVQEAWTFEVDDEISINNFDVEGGVWDTPIFIKENDSLDGEVEVKFLTPEQLVIRGFVVDEEFPVPSITSRSDTIRIVTTDLNVEMELLTHEGVFNRFLVSESRSEVMDDRMHFDNTSIQLLVIEIPSGVEVVSDSDRLFDHRQEAE